MVTAPKPPGSRQFISPLTAVFEIAPEKVLQGAVRLHGFWSSPTPDTQVRLACAWAAIAKARAKQIINNNLIIGSRAVILLSPYCVHWIEFMRRLWLKWIGN